MKSLLAKDILMTSIIIPKEKKVFVERSIFREFSLLERKIPFMYLYSHKLKEKFIPNISFMIPVN